MAHVLRMLSLLHAKPSASTQQVQPLLLEEGDCRTSSLQGAARVAKYAAHDAVQTSVLQWSHACCNSSFQRHKVIVSSMFAHGPSSVVQSCCCVLQNGHLDYSYAGKNIPRLHVDLYTGPQTKQADLEICRRRDRTLWLLGEGACGKVYKVRHCHADVLKAYALQGGIHLPCIIM